MHAPTKQQIYVHKYVLEFIKYFFNNKSFCKSFFAIFFPHKSNANCVCKSLATVLLKAVFNPIWCFLKGLAYCFKKHIHLLHSMLHSLFFSMYIVYAFDLNITEKSSPQFIEVTRESCKKECPTPNCMLKTS